MTSHSMILRNYQPADAQGFAALNRDWIEQFFTLEASDRAQLEQPDTTILQRGGKIVIAEINGQVVGTGGLMVPQHAPNDGRQWLEVVKMATARAERRQGIGRAVMTRLVEEAMQMRADALWLETHPTLGAAIQLYESAGFRHLTPDEFWTTPYQRSNVQMVREL